MRELVAAAVQVAPSSGPLTAESIAGNCARAVALVRDCVAATGAELVVLPESVTTGFTPGVDVETLWDLVSEIPGPVLDPFTAVAAELGIHLVVGSVRARPAARHRAQRRRGDRPVRASARRLPQDAPVRRRAGRPRRLGHAGRGHLRRRHPAGPDRLIICFDGDYPELSRITAIKGAEIICRPSALLRSADIWELTNRARAYDNHVYVIGANATGVDPAGVIYFGNSMIVTPIAEVVARASSHECWVSARLDPATAMASLTPGSSVPQSFDHLADRNLALIRRHADALLGEAATSFVHGGKPDDIVD